MNKSEYDIAIKPLIFPPFETEKFPPFGTEAVRIHLKRTKEIDENSTLEIKVDKRKEIR